MKHEAQLYVDRIETLAHLPEEQRRVLQDNPRLQSVLEENRALQQLAAGATEPPDRSTMLERVYAESLSTQEKQPMLIQRLFAGKPLAIRLALAAAVLLIVAALSLLLPRTVLTRHGVEMHGVPSAYAATDGYMLVYDFGEADLEAVEPLIDQLTEAVRAFKKEHNLPAEKTKRAFKISVTKEQRHVAAKTAAGGQEGGSTEDHSSQANKVIMVIDLQDDTLLEELKAELAKIPGLPEPRITDATWFSQKGLPLPDDKDGVGIKLNLGNGEHTFTFPKDATTEEMQQAITEWLARDNPGRDFKVKVEKMVERGKTRIEIRIEGQQEATGVAAHEQRIKVTPEGDTLKLAVNFGEVAHEFTFAKSASEQQMAEEINAWLAANLPEHDVQASVKKIETDGKTQLEVKIVTVDTGDSAPPG